MQDLNIDERGAKPLTDPVSDCQSLLQQDGIITSLLPLRLSSLFLRNTKLPFAGA
ncbi:MULTISPECIES: hypothetical protein [unclassified Serratia (in: enterobacteria)]|uniref:hypothetical protein n=1 Tax=unclassified Serratia (in: enterobacteria) TaxID=2647522 RepID=UPI0030761026